ncbi:MAG TPA: phosphoribosyl-AMP cyclohydrolase [Clostridia bacterium]|nr:phosphoribosyl-AMP cyclohydrolase [Clostridia bacterium]
MKFDAEQLKFDKAGLIPTIIQDADDNAVLMMAYMNKNSVQKTIETGETWFWSRSRQKYWHKGESSGNVQIVKEMYFDCDADTLLIKVKQLGDAACHMGYRSCFFNSINKQGQVEVVGELIFDPEVVYGKKD